MTSTLFQAICQGLRFTYRYTSVHVLHSTVACNLSEHKFHNRSHLQVPGEQGESTLCTDPDWCTVMLALKFLGLPFEVENAKQVRE
jgi:hypothetical protein